uniref:Uncharacterized protein n=1 Tax=Lygus hesperus TaxID=30085 RepID=A0A146KV02_LYGHE
MSYSLLPTLAYVSDTDQRFKLRYLHSSIHRHASSWFTNFYDNLVSLPVQKLFLYTKDSPLGFELTEYPLLRDAIDAGHLRMQLIHESKHHLHEDSPTLVAHSIHAFCSIHLHTVF